MHKTNLFRASLPFVVGLVLLLIGIKILYTLIKAQPSQDRRDDYVVALAKPQLDQQLTMITIANQPLQVRVVNQPASITRGLSAQDNIGADGMLFILGRDQNATFWMKDMRFGLDMIWLRDGQVVAVTENIPHPSPDTADAVLPLYSPEQAVDMVLEVPAGQAADWGISEGARLQLL